MSSANVETSPISGKGEGYCAGGRHPEPPLDAYPLLAWTEAHRRFGAMVVHLEDQKATVHDIAVAHAQTPSVEALADQFDTTTDHIDQALAYAAKCGFSS